MFCHTFSALFGKNKFQCFLSVKYRKVEIPKICFKNFISGKKPSLQLLSAVFLQYEIYIGLGSFKILLQTFDNVRSIVSLYY